MFKQVNLNIDDGILFHNEQKNYIFNRYRNHYKLNRKRIFIIHTRLLYIYFFFL